MRESGRVLPTRLHENRHTTSNLVDKGVGEILVLVVNQAAKNWSPSLTNASAYWNNAPCPESG